MSGLISSVAGLRRVTCCHFPPTRCVLFSTGQSFVYVFCFPPRGGGLFDGFPSLGALVNRILFHFLKSSLLWFLSSRSCCRRGSL